MSRPSPRAPPSPSGDAADGVVAETFKVLVLGNSDVGKTSLIKLYTTGEMTTKLLPTVGEIYAFVAEHSVCGLEVVYILYSFCLLRWFVSQLEMHAPSHTHVDNASIYCSIQMSFKKSKAVCTCVLFSKD